MEAFQQHGGRLQAAMRAWPRAPLPWVDLSTGVSPFAYPAPRASRAARARLPFPEEIAALKEAAAAAFGIADPARVVATAGAETALRLLPSLLGAQTVHVAAPTYAGHADAWTLAGARLVGAHEAAVRLLVNPNNPDGRLLAPDTLLAMAEQPGWLVVDESFVDALDGMSVAPAAHPRIVVLRSFGKMYGLPGVRLGFAILPPDLAARLRALLGDWPVSADAIEAGLAAYRDPRWLARTKRRLHRAAARLDRALRQGDFAIIGGTPLFRLTESDDAPHRFARLAEQGILTRPFAGQPRWLRIGLPPTAQRLRVERALASLA